MRVDLTKLSMACRPMNLRHPEKKTAKFHFEGGPKTGSPSVTWKSHQAHGANFGEKVRLKAGLDVPIFVGWLLPSFLLSFQG